MVDRRVYLSAHLDDAVFSCGGLIAKQVRKGRRVLVITVFAGDPDSGPQSEFAAQLHRKWNLGPDPMADRRVEDQTACGFLGVDFLHFRFQDAIYRSEPQSPFLYPDEDAIFGKVNPGEIELQDRVARSMQAVLSPADRVYAPLAIGAHVDHQIIQRAAAHLPLPKFSYLDIPYWLKESNGTALDRIASSVYPLDSEDVERWVEASFCYASQAPLFWRDRAQMSAGIERFLGENAGFPLFE